jgi:phosphoglycolate phosphatase
MPIPFQIGKFKRYIRNRMSEIRNVLEIVNQDLVPAKVRVVLFDLDGTLSLIRSGWMEMMCSMFIQELRPLDTQLTDAELQHFAEEIILQLTGKETIYQMAALTDAVRSRGRNPLSADEYKAAFLDQLLAQVEANIQSIESDPQNREKFLVPGARALLDDLAARGITLYLASGTDDESVTREASVLGIARYFGDRIYGARTDEKGFTKAALVHHLVNELGHDPRELLGFGDGFVEISEIRKAGGIGVGVATREPLCIEVHQNKRRHLIAAGADLIIPNYLEQSRFLPLLIQDSRLRRRGSQIDSVSLPS